MKKILLMALLSYGVLSYAASSPNSDQAPSNTLSEANNPSSATVDPNSLEGNTYAWNNTGSEPDEIENKHFDADDDSDPADYD